MLRSLFCVNYLSSFFQKSFSWSQEGLRGLRAVVALTCSSLIDESRRNPFLAIISSRLPRCSWLPNVCPFSLRQQVFV